MVKSSYFSRLLIKVLCLTIIGCALAACKEEVEIVEQIRSLKTITVSEMATKQIRKFSGIVKAVDSSNLSFEVGGNVKTVHVDIGDPVRKGQVLAVLDKEPYRLDLDAAQAELVAAKAKVDNDKEAYNRQVRVFEQGAGSKSRLDRTKYDLESALSQVNVQVATVNFAKRNLTKTTLAAPYDGYIAWRSVEPHEEIKTGQRVFVIDAKGAMEVQLAVPETTINRIRIGTSATVQFPTLPDRSVKGRISYIGSAAVKSNAFPVKVSLVGKTANISPGMTAEVALAMKEGKQTAGYLVPFQAILPAKEAGQAYAFVYDPQTTTVRKTPIKTLAAQNNLMVVSEGLSAGDIIAIAGVSFLADGMKVNLLEE
jgi:RND family efflux transporter MFP subunit